MTTKKKKKKFSFCKSKSWGGADCGLEAGHTSRHQNAETSICWPADAEVEMESEMKKEHVCLSPNGALECARPRGHVGEHSAEGKDWGLLDAEPIDPYPEYATCHELEQLTTIVKCFQSLEMKGQHERVLVYLNSRFGKGE